MEEGRGASRLDTKQGAAAPKEDASPSTCRSEAASGGSFSRKISAGSFAFLFARPSIRSLGSVSEEAWWSKVPQPMTRLEKDMRGAKLVSRVVKVLGERSPPARSGLDFDWFERYLPHEQLKDGHTYLLTGLVCGKATFVSLSVVVDTIFEDVCAGDCLTDRLKLIVQPINLAVPVPLKGPKDAATIGSFFGRRHCHLSRAQRGDVKLATLAIDLYSVMSLRLALPKLAFTAGRIVDFHVVSYQHRACLASFRIATNRQLLGRLRELTA